MHFEDVCLSPFSDLVPRARAPCLGTKMDVVQTRQCPGASMFTLGEAKFTISTSIAKLTEGIKY